VGGCVGGGGHLDVRGEHGKFHYNEGARHDYYFLNGLQYVDIGIAETKRLIAAGVGTVDEGEFPEEVRAWREDSKGLDPEVVFASMAADPA
jgi:hypothetical protein